MGRKMDGKIRFGLIGCGDMGLRHLKAYIGMKKNGVGLVELVSLCDVRRERAEALASVAKREMNASLEVYSDAVEMCRRANLDAVDIVVPPMLHHTVAISCLEEGKHALVEKPFGITVRACRNMMEAAKENNRLVAVAENYRRTHRNRALKAILSRGLIGDVYFVFKNGVSPRGDRVWVKVLDRQPSPWRHDRLQMGAYAIEYGAHDADLLRYWFGEVEEIYGVAKTFEGVRHMWAEGKPRKIEAKADDTDFAILRFSRGALCQWSMSIAGHGEGYSQLVIFGSRGCIKGLGYALDDGTRRSEDEVMKEFRSTLTEEERKRLFPPGTVHEGEYDTDGSDPLKYGVAIEIHDFADSIAGKRRPEVDASDGLKAVAIGLALMESATLNQPVKVRDVEELRIEEYQREINNSLGIR